MKIAELLEEANRMIDEDPSQTDAYYFRGKTNTRAISNFKGLAYFIVEDWLSALNNFEQVVSMADNAHEAYVASSLTYSSYAFSALGENDSALEVVNQAIEMNPKSIAAVR